MNKRQERALEVFVYVTFAIALFAGVGNTKSDSGIFPISFEVSKGEVDTMRGNQPAFATDTWYEDR